MSNYQRVRQRWNSLKFHTSQLFWCESPWPLTPSHVMIVFLLGEFTSILADNVDINFEYHIRWWFIRWQISALGPGIRMGKVILFRIPSINIDPGWPWRIGGWEITFLYILYSKTWRFSIWTWTWVVATSGLLGLKNSGSHESPDRWY